MRLVWASARRGQLLAKRILALFASFASFAFFAFFALSFVGCFHSRDVAPWFRMSSTTTPCLIAESGGTGCHTTAQTERLENGRWVPVAGFEARAFAFAGGERVVYGRRLFKRSGGPPEPLACKGDLRATPDGDRLVCTQLGRAFRDQTVVVTVLDRDGAPIEERIAPFPIRVPDDEPPLGDYVAPHLLGFTSSGLVLSFELVRASASRATGSAHRCDAFTLTPDGTWRPLGALVYRTPEEWKCAFPRPWNDLHGWKITPGITERDL